MQDMNKRVKASEQDKEKRLKNFDEVTNVYTLEEAMEEAKRCLNCKTRPCTQGCPIGNDIPDFIAKIVEGKIEEAYNIAKNKNNFPAICGRVCPQEDQCEGNCVRGKKGESLCIGGLERFCADYTLAIHNEKERDPSVALQQLPYQGSQAKVAIIGSGPAGLACARDLAEKGYKVTVLEALEILGGILNYGIPKFRLPRNVIDIEVEAMKKMGVEFITNKKIGQDLTIDDLYNQGYECIFIATGANTPRMMGIEGEDLEGVYPAYEYLMKINLNERDHGMLIGKKVVIVGGGNVAIDAARVSKRLGAEEVTIIYRRTLAEMPARRDEIKHAEDEGIEFKFLTNPVKFIGENGKLTKIECVEMELGEPDESGRRSPIEKKGSNFSIEADTVVTAVGQLHDHHIITKDMVDIHKQGGILVKEDTMETSKEGLFAGGDVVSGGATVIEAIKAGKKAAKAIDEKLKKN